MTQITSVMKRELLAHFRTASSHYCLKHLCADRRRVLSVDGKITRRRRRQYEPALLLDRHLPDPVHTRANHASCGRRATTGNA